MPIRFSLRPAAVFAALALAALPSAASSQALSLALLIPGDETPPVLVIVPDVRGQTLSGAAVRVADVGLVPRHAASSPGDLDTSPVRRQWPRAGQRVPEGTVVALELATPSPVPLTARAARPASDRTESSAAWLARTSVSASFDTRDGAGNAPAGALWWVAAVICGAPLLVLALRKMEPRRPASAPARRVDAGAAAREAASLGPPEAGGRRRRVVWVKRTRGAPRVAVAPSGSIAAAEDVARL